jgi:hypothetical protein
MRPPSNLRQAGLRGNAGPFLRYFTRVRICGVFSNKSFRTPRNRLMRFGRFRSFWRNVESVSYTVSTRGRSFAPPSSTVFSCFLQKVRRLNFSAQLPRNLRTVPVCAQCMRFPQREKKCPGSVRYQYRGAFQPVVRGGGIANGKPPYSNSALAKLLLFGPLNGL